MVERSPNENDPIGKIISDYRVTGVEMDGNDNWVGADLKLTIPPIGEFVLNIMTRQHSEDEKIRGIFDDIANPHRLLDDVLPDQKDSFVLNDHVLSDEVIAKKFANRLVAEDLADSLWFVGPSNA
jgi:hypothetical protein